MKSNCIFQKKEGLMYCIIRELIEFQPKSRKTDIAQFYRNSKKRKYCICDWFHVGRLRATLKIASKNTTSPAYASTIFRRKNARFRYGFYAWCRNELSNWSIPVRKQKRMNYENSTHDKVNYFKETFSRFRCCKHRVDESYVKKIAELL
jgi:hypothetical protein